MGRTEFRPCLRGGGFERECDDEGSGYRGMWQEAERNVTHYGTGMRRRVFRAHRAEQGQRPWAVEAGVIYLGANTSGYLRRGRSKERALIARIHALTADEYDLERIFFLFWHSFISRVYGKRFGWEAEIVTAYPRGIRIGEMEGWGMGEGGEIVFIEVRDPHGRLRE